MTKQELAEYLVNLHFLMDAQEKTAIHKSEGLLAEYKYHWDLLKEAVANEARQRKDRDGRKEGSAVGNGG